MDVAGTLINVFVVVAVGGIFTYVTHDRFRELKAEIAGHRQETRSDSIGLRQEFKADIAELRSELKGDIARLEDRMDAGFNAVRSEFNVVRSDITAIALAVGASTPRAPGETRQA